MSSKPRDLAFIDEMFGYRACWLILYGILPSCLSILGIGKKIEISQKALSNIIVFLPILLIPAFISFSYITHKCRQWYFTTRWLWFRSCFLTISIFILASLICLFSQLNLSLDDIFRPENYVWQNFHAPFFRSMAMGIASITISSTIFSSILLGKVHILGLPSKEFEENLKTVKKQLRMLQNHSIWKQCPQKDVLEAFVAQCKDGHN